MGCASSVHAREASGHDEWRAGKVGKVIADEGGDDGNTMPIHESISDPRLGELTLQSLRSRAEGSFTGMSSLLELSPGRTYAAAYMIENGLLEELAAVLHNNREQDQHKAAGQIIDTLREWALDQTREQYQLPKSKEYDTAVRCLGMLVEYQKADKDPLDGARRGPGLFRPGSFRRTGSFGRLVPEVQSDGTLQSPGSFCGRGSVGRTGSNDNGSLLQRTSSFECNEHGLYPEIVVELQKPYRINRVNERWISAFGHAAEKSLGRTINLIMGPDTDTEKFLGLLKTTKLEGSATGLLAFHDSEGTSSLITLTVRGIGNDEYHSSMLIFR